MITQPPQAPPLTPGVSSVNVNGVNGCDDFLGFPPIPTGGRNDNQDAADLDETSSPDQRFDRVSIKLERRGVTSQIPKQGFLFAKELVFKESIVAKLDEAHRQDLADLVRGCHLTKSVRQCRGCKAHSVFWNRCDVKWCPICQGRLARERRESVEWWTQQIHQPKHVVLTARNTEEITRESVLAFKAAFAKLRRRTFASNWIGGFYSLEVTNEGRGWHLHLHALVDAKWIDSGELARQWADCVGQDMSIVKVKDARDRSYLQEVTKYAVKGSEFASWSKPDIIAFIESFEGVRTFGVFGSLYKKRTEWKEFLDGVRDSRVTCDCGCKVWRIFSESEWEWEEAKNGPPVFAPPTGLSKMSPVGSANTAQKEFALLTGYSRNTAHSS